MVSRRLPPETIQRIVRQNHGRFRNCYQKELLRDPDLEGLVSVRFVISRSGTVSNVSGKGEGVPNSLVSCITRTMYGLTFPQPDGGVVTVIYPFRLNPWAAERPANEGVRAVDSGLRRHMEMFGLRRFLDSVAAQPAGAPLRAESRN